MAARSEREVLVEYATRDEETLSLALSIAEAQENICTKVIADFLAAVVIRLAGRLGEPWNVTSCHSSQDSDRSLELLSAKYRPHPGRFAVVIAADQPGFPKSVYMAVRSESGHEHYKELKRHLDEVVQGKVGDPSLWYRYLDAAYTDWGSAATTPKLLNAETVDYFVTYLERLARAVERGLTTLAPS